MSTVFRVEAVDVRVPHIFRGISTILPTFDICVQKSLTAKRFRNNDIFREISKGARKPPNSILLTVCSKLLSITCVIYCLHASYCKTLPSSQNHLPYPYISDSTAAWMKIKQVYFWEQTYTHKISHFYQQNMEINGVLEENYQIWDILRLMRRRYMEWFKVAGEYRRGSMSWIVNTIGAEADRHLFWVCTPSGLVLVLLFVFCSSNSSSNNKSALQKIRHF